MTDDTAVSTEREEGEPGSTHTSAHELGDITAQWIAGGLRKLEQTVGAEGDGVDYYRFTLSEAREVRLGLKLREGEAALSVEDGAGNVLARSVAYGAHEAAVRTFLPGTYYVRVEAAGTVASAYEFKYGVLEADASIRPSNPQGWYAGTAQKLGMPWFEEAGYGFELSESSDGRVRAESLGTVLAVDPSGEELSYRIVGGNGSGSFAIDGASGELSYVGGGEDYESGVTSHELTVRASDGTQTVDTLITVTITDAAEAPAFREESYTFALSENADGSVNRLSLGTVTATDPDGDELSYRIVRGNDSELFAIDAASGELSYVGPGEDYESGVTSYALTVRASDGAHASHTTVTVALGDVRGRSEPEGDDLAADRTTSGLVLVDEGAVTGDIEAPGDVDWFAVQLVAGRTYRIDVRGQPTGDGTLVDAHLHGVYDGDGGLIGGTTDFDGGTSHNSRLVFTAPREGTHYIAASGGNATQAYGTGTYELEVLDVEAPVFAESGYRFALSENTDGSASGIALGTVQATDPDGGSVSYSLAGGNDSGLFAIDETSGELSYVGPGEDYESGDGSYELTVQASDGAYSSEVTVTVTVTDVAEAPAFSEESYEFALVENTDGSVSRQSLGPVTATDPDGDAVRYNLVGGNDSGLFAIDEASGELFYVGPGEDYESDDGSYELTVRASDGAHPVDTMVTVTVVDDPSDSGKTTIAQGSSEPAGEDLPAGRETSGEVRVDAEPVEGTLRSPSDRDWFAVTLAPGRTYVFAVEGDTPRGGAGAAPAIRGLRDANGDPVAGIVGGTEVRYATDGAATEAVYYIEVGGEGGLGQGRSATRGVGTRGSVATRSIVDTPGSSDGGTGYRLRANDITETKDAADDYSSATSTTGVVMVGGSATGEIDFLGDRDWFAVTLVAGGTYLIDLKGTVSNVGTLDDPYLHGIYNSQGILIGDTTDDDGGVLWNSRVFFSATDGGTYYVSAGGNESGTNTFRHSVTGTYRLSVRELEGEGGQTAGTDTSGTVLVGGSVTGEIDFFGDRDWFAVTLVAGGTYLIDLKGTVSNVGTLDDPYLHGIYNSQGILIGDTTDDDGGVLWNSRVFFSATDGGTYYVSAGGNESGTNTFRHSVTGTYRLSVRELEGAQTAGTDTSGTVLVGGSVEDLIDFPYDRDWFAVTLVAGRTYRFDLEGSWHGLTVRGGGGPLADPYLHGIYDSQGTLIGGTTDDDGGSGRNSRVLYEATEDGTHYVSAGADGSRMGAYRLSVTDAYPADAQTARTNTSGTVSVGDSVTKKIDYADDRDWFAVTLEAGKTYRFDLEGTSTGAGTLADPYLYGIFNSQGILIGGTTDDDDGAGPNSRVLYKATEDGTHYVSAGAFGAGKGTYKLSVTEADPQTAGTDTSGTVPVDGSVTGEIDFGGDRDWFAVDLEAGKTYRFDLEGTSTGAGTLADPYLYGIFNSQGILIGGTTDDNDGVHLNSQVFFEATDGGTHYLSAGAEGSETGTYRLSVTDVVAADAQTAGTDTTGTVRAGGSVTGEIDYASDRDWFAVPLRAGKSYRIDLEGSPTGAGTLDDPYLFGVHDSAGNPIGGTTDDDGGVYRNSRVDFEPATDGRYFVSVGGDGIDTGTYTLSIEEGM